MSKYAYFILGILFICWGFNSLFTGETFGFSIGNNTGRVVTLTESFIEYCVSVTVIFICGGALVWDVLVYIFRPKNKANKQINQDK